MDASQSYLLLSASFVFVQISTSTFSQSGPISFLETVSVSKVLKVLKVSLVEVKFFFLVLTSDQIH